jgi:hydrogenase expression/formation protein HypC
MCLAVPGELINIEGNIGTVSFSGACRGIDLRLVPEAKVGDYLLVHAGCAIQVVPADEARATLELLAEIMPGEEL